jgi:hypothetical protein
VGSVGLTAVPTMAVRLCVAALAVAAAACGNDQRPELEPSAPRYRDVVELFDQGIARTCALNNGVCHNSNNYPDLHTVSNLIATIDQPCNVDVTDAALVHDACEPPADRLVVPSAGVDVRIVRAHLLPSELEADVRDLTQVTLVVDREPTSLVPGATDPEVHRDGTVFEVGAHGARVAAVTGTEVVLDLRANYGQWSAKQFFDVRDYPPGFLRVHVGDPNGNGIEGARTVAMPMVMPGDPARSYLVRRLIDESYGELMPRQCRTWDDEANRAIACWIAGLAVDGAGNVLNAYEPIDYAACRIAVGGLGKCAPVVATGFTAVEQIFARSCGGNGCHVREDEPGGGLDLSAGVAHAALVGVASLGARDRVLVEPGDPDASYLMCKLLPACDLRRGDRMPLEAAALSDGELATIRAWIADGAPR